jgi:hypothetical protein
MPKTSIYENSQSCRGKRKIWISENRSAAPPTANLKIAKDFYQAELSRTIFGALNS